MKIRIAYLQLIILSTCLCIGSCGKIEEIDTTPVSEEVGFLSLKTALKGEIRVTTGKRPPTLDDILNDINVRIYRTDDPTGLFSLIIDSNYGDLPTTIELLSGEYLLQMYSSGLAANQYTGRWDNGDYGWNGNFTITAGNNTDIDAALSLFDTALTIDYTDEVITEYPDINVNASFSYAGNGTTLTQSWPALEDGRTAYFNMTEFVVIAADGYEALFGLTGNLNLEISGGSSFITRSYPNVSANEHYMITVSYSGDSSATIVVTLGDEIIIEDVIEFPG